jgi:hypothetical protein
MNDPDPKTESLDALAARAMIARDGAYAPYSGFPVGAAILTSDGRVLPDAMSKTCRLAPRSVRNDPRRFRRLVREQDSLPR